ncbi:ankyrin repeat domain-containing protein [Planctomycetota bacterium]
MDCRFVFVWFVIAVLSIAVCRNVEEGQRAQAVEEVGEQLPVEVQATLRKLFPDYILPIEHARLMVQLRDAIRDGNEVEVRRLLDLGVNPNRNDRASGVLPLFLAIRNGNVRIVEILLDHGTNVDPVPFGRRMSARSFNAAGHSPLYFAVRVADREMVELLLDRGADPNVRNRARKTPIMGAVERGDVELFELLIERGAECDFAKMIRSGPYRERQSATLAETPKDELGLEALHHPTAPRMRFRYGAKATGKAELIAAVEREYQKWLMNNSPDKTQLFMDAVGYGDVEYIRRTIAQGQDLTYKNHGRSLLYWAAAVGQTEVCRILMDAGLSPNEESTDGIRVTPVSGAIESGSVETLELLLERDGSLEAVHHGKSNSSPIKMAIARRSEEMLDFLIGRGESLDDPTIVPFAMWYRYGQFGTAADQEHRRILTKLIDAGAKVDPHAAYNNAVWMALSSGQFEMFRKFEKRVEVDFHEKVLNAAIIGGNVEACRYVMRKGATLDEDPKERMEILRRSLVLSRNTSLIEFLFSIGVPKQYPTQHDVSGGLSNFDEYGHPLYHAALKGDTDQIRYLFELFPGSEMWQPLIYRPSDEDNDSHYFQRGNTPLFAAVYGDHAKTLKLLLAYGLREGPQGNRSVDINAKNDRGNTVLHEAAMQGAAKCVQILLAAGADATAPRLNGKRSDGNTPLQALVEDANPPEMFPMLAAANQVQNPDWLETPNRYGATPLHTAAALGNFGVCKKLIEFGADASTLSEYGGSTVYEAIRTFNRTHDKSARVRLCQLLIESGNPLESVKPELSLYRIAAERGLFDFCDYMLEKGDQPDIQNNGESVLCYAASFGRVDHARRMLDAGVDVDCQPEREKATPLHLAVSAKDHAMCEFLIDRGANPNARDWQRRTPLHYALRRFGSNYISVEFDTVAVDRATVEVVDLLKLLIAAGAEVDETVLSQPDRLPAEIIELLK